MSGRDHGLFSITLYWLSFFQIFMDQYFLFIHEISSCELLKAENRTKINKLEPTIRMHLQELLKRKRWAAAITGFFFIILYWLSFFQIFMDQNVLLIHDRSCCEQLKAENKIKISQLEPELHSWVYALGRRERCGVAILCARPHPPYTPNIFLNEFRRLKKMTLGAPKNTEIRKNTEKSHACVSDSL